MNKRIVNIIDREREAIARRHRLAARSIARKTERAVVGALIKGILSVANTPDIVRENLAPLPVLLAEAMLEAHLVGFRRTLILAKVAAATNKVPLSLTRSTEAGGKKRAQYLQQKLKIDPTTLEKLGRQYRTAGIQVARDASGVVERRITRTLLKAQQDGLGKSETVSKLRDAFKRSGVSDVEDHHLETIFRTQTQLAYGAGRWNASQDPAIQEILWGYEYITVGDNRVRPNHAAMHGKKFKKDDSVWSSWWPPCGHNCRCTTLEIFDDSAPSRPSRVPKGARPDRGFDFNAGHVFNVQRANAALDPTVKPDPTKFVPSDIDIIERRRKGESWEAIREAHPQLSINRIKQVYYTAGEKSLPSPSPSPLFRRAKMKGRVRK